MVSGRTAAATPVAVRRPVRAEEARVADLLPMLALFAAAVAWFLLPLLPALRELLRPTDLAALKVVDRSSGYVAYFARNFRNYLEKQTALLPAEQQVGDFLGRLPDGTRLVRIHKAVTTLEREGKDGPEKRLVVVDVPLRLEGGETFLMELYARAPLTGGPEAVYRAVYAEKDLTLGEGSTVLRWAHAGGRLAVGRDSVLRGRISSDTGVELGPGVVFERIGAPIISAGDHGLFEPPPPPPAPPPPPPPPPRPRRGGPPMAPRGWATMCASRAISRYRPASGWPRPSSWRAGSPSGPAPPARGASRPTGTSFWRMRSRSAARWKPAPGWSTGAAPGSEGRPSPRRASGSAAARWSAG